MLNQIASLDAIFHALADPGRRAMLERLSRGASSVSELAEPLDMSLPAVMQHLQVLEASGLIHSQKAGRVRTCTLDQEALAPARRWIERHQTIWEKRFDALGQYLAENPESTTKE
jgi:DNA-binding transcriptional ArsR family regulator